MASSAFREATILSRSSSGKKAACAAARMVSFRTPWGHLKGRMKVAGLAGIGSQRMLAAILVPPSFSFLTTALFDCLRGGSGFGGFGSFDGSDLDAAGPGSEGTTEDQAAHIPQ